MKKFDSIIKEELGEVTLRVLQVIRNGLQLILVLLFMYGLLKNYPFSIVWYWGDFMLIIFLMIAAYLIPSFVVGSVAWIKQGYRKDKA